jgi:hypothetical protein
VQRAAGAGRLALDATGLVQPTTGRRRPLARLEPDGTVRYLR